MAQRKKKNVHLECMQRWPTALSQGSKVLLYLKNILLVIGGIALIRDTAANGHDFKVFWRGARALVDGVPVYSVLHHGGMIFKYPPWTLPFFLPFALIPLGPAHYLWGFLQVASLAYCAHWLKTQLGCRKGVVDLSVLLFWGIWVVHALDGQITLLMLAVVLWAGKPDEKGLDSISLKNFILVLTLSIKIHTLFPLLNYRISRYSLRTIILIGLSLVGILVGVGLYQTHFYSISEALGIFSAWKGAATSSAQLLGVDQVRGRWNPGLTGYFLRLFSVPPDQVQVDVGLAFFLCGVLGWAWKRFSKSLSPTERWVGWLGLVPVVHPLPWWHLFVFAFPLSTLAFDRSFQIKSKIWLLHSLVGFALIGFSSEKALGQVGYYLEMNAAKSWGVLLCLFVLVQVTKKNRDLIACRSSK